MGRNGRSRLLHVPRIPHILIHSWYILISSIWMIKMRTPLNPLHQYNQGGWGWNDEVGWRSRPSHMWHTAGGIQTLSQRATITTRGPIITNRGPVTRKTSKGIVLKHFKSIFIVQMNMACVQCVHCCIRKLIWWHMFRTVRKIGFYITPSFLTSWSEMYRSATLNLK